MREVDKIRKAVHDSFSEKLDAAFFKTFRRKLTTRYDWINMNVVSTPTNGKPFTPKQKAWVAGYSEGYGHAMEQIWSKP